VLVAHLTAIVVAVVGSVGQPATIVVVDARRASGVVTSHDVVVGRLNNTLRTTCPTQK
jgi:hypothetical protein